MQANGNNGGLTKIDVTELPQGVYFLTYVDENSHKITKKIIKK